MDHLYKALSHLIAALMLIAWLGTMAFILAMFSCI